MKELSPDRKERPPPRSRIPHTQVKRSPPFRMMVADPVWVVLPPPIRRVPNMLVIPVAPPFRVMVADPVRIVLPPPIPRAPNMVRVPMAPPRGVMAPHPIRLVRLPPGRVVPLINFVIVADTWPRALTRAC